MKYGSVFWGCNTTWSGNCETEIWSKGKNSNLSAARESELEAHWCWKCFAAASIPRNYPACYLFCTNRSEGRSHCGRTLGFWICADTAARRVISSECRRRCIAPACRWSYQCIYFGSSRACGSILRRAETATSSQHSSEWFGPDRSQSLRWLMRPSASRMRYSRDRDRRSCTDAKPGSIDANTLRWIYHTFAALAQLFPSICGTLDSLSRCTFWWSGKTRTRR